MQKIDLLIFLLQVLPLAISAIGWLIETRSWFFRSHCKAIQAFNKLRTCGILYHYDSGFKELVPLVKKEFKDKDFLNIERFELGEGGLASDIEKPEWSGVSYNFRVVFSNGKDKKLLLNVNKAIEDYYYPEKVKKEKWAAFLFWGGLFAEFIIVLISVFN